jgi:TonB family protein
MNRNAAGLLLLAVFLVHIAAYAESVKDALNHKYKKQVLGLRSPFPHGDLTFDSSGQPLSAPDAGHWLMYGGIFIKKLSLSPDALRLEGPRVAFTGEQKNGKPIVILVGTPVKVEIRLEKTLDSPDEAQTLLGRIFFLQDDQFEHAKPDYRRSDEDIAAITLYHVDKDGTKAPKPTYTPEPSFSEEARRAKFQGTVTLNIAIDKEGKVFRIRIDKAAGRGLDENAVESVKTWRFVPATRDGQPVAVEMKIEVAFNLY